MKTSRSTGSRFCLLSNLALLVESASTARIDFFSGVSKIPQGAPNRRNAGIYPNFLFQLRAELLQTSVWCFRDEI